MYANSDQFYVTLFSTSSHKLYTDNTHSAYTVELAWPIELGAQDNWEVGVCEFSYPAATTTNRAEHCLIYVDIITPQMVGDRLVRCVRSVLHPTPFNHELFAKVQYVPVEKKRFGNISVEILTLEGKPFPMADSETPSKLVLHFRRIPALKDIYKTALSRTRTYRP